MVLCWYPFLLSKGDIKILFLIQWIQFLVYWIQFDKRLIQFWEFCFRSIVLAGCLTGSDVDSCIPRLLEQSAEINSFLSEIKEKRILIEYDLWLAVERNSWFAARRFYWISLFGPSIFLTKHLWTYWNRRNSLVRFTAENERTTSSAGSGY